MKTRLSKPNYSQNTYPSSSNKIKTLIQKKPIRRIITSNRGIATSTKSHERNQYSRTQNKQRSRIRIRNRSKNRNRNNDEINDSQNKSNSIKKNNRNNGSILTQSKLNETKKKFIINPSNKFKSSDQPKTLDKNSESCSNNSQSQNSEQINRKLSHSKTPQKRSGSNPKISNSDSKVKTTSGKISDIKRNSQKQSDLQQKNEIIQKQNQSAAYLRRQYVLWSSNQFSYLLRKSNLNQKIDEVQEDCQKSINMRSDDDDPQCQIQNEKHKKTVPNSPTAQERKITMEFPNKIKTIFQMLESDVKEISKLSKFPQQWSFLLLMSCNWNKQYCQKYVNFEHQHERCLCLAYEQKSQILIGLIEKCKLCHQSSQVFYKNNCGHFYCYECWLNYVKEFYEKLGFKGDSKFELPPCISCQKVLSPQLILEIIPTDPTLQIRYKYYLCHSYISSGKKYIRCKNYIESQNQIEICDELIFMNTNIDSSQTNCPKCKIFYCSKCEQYDHFPSKCQQFKKWKQQWSKNQTYRLKNGFINCKECDNKIQKIFGVTNPFCKCTQRYCKICGQEWTMRHKQFTKCQSEAVDKNHRAPIIEIRLSQAIKGTQCQRQIYSLQNKIQDLNKLNFQAISKYLRQGNFFSADQVKSIKEIILVYSRGLNYLKNSQIVRYFNSDRKQGDLIKEKLIQVQKNFYLMQHFILTEIPQFVSQFKMHEQLADQKKYLYKLKGQFKVMQHKETQTKIKIEKIINSKQKELTTVQNSQKSSNK